MRAHASRPVDIALRKWVGLWGAGCHSVIKILYNKQERRERLESLSITWAFWKMLEGGKTRPFLDSGIQ